MKAIMETPHGAAAGLENTTSTSPSAILPFLTLAGWIRQWTRFCLNWACPREWGQRDKYCLVFNVFESQVIAIWSSRNYVTNFMFFVGIFPNEAMFEFLSKLLLKLPEFQCQHYRQYLRLKLYHRMLMK